MNAQSEEFVVGQRVRIWEVDDEQTEFLGQMGTITSDGQAPQRCDSQAVKLDHTKQTLVLPSRYLRLVKTAKSSLLANELFLPWDMDDPNRRLRAYTASRWVAAHLVETLLFYEHVTVPTVDFAVVVPLIHWLSIPLFKELLLSNSLQFVRYRGSIGYSGDGLGIVLHEIRGPSTPDSWWVDTACLPTTEAVQLQLRHRLEGVPEQVRDSIASLVGLSTIDTSLPLFQSRVADETYRDIAASRLLHGRFLANPSDLAHLPGVGPNEMRTYMRRRHVLSAGDGIDIALRVAMANLEIYLAEESGTRDMAPPPGFDGILGAKATRYTGNAEAAKSFSALLRVEGVPDLATQIVQGELTLAHLWDFGNQQTSAQFREWFEEVGPSNPDVVLQEYTKCLRTSSGFASTPGKLIRFIVLQCVGLALAPVTGVGSLALTGAASAVDCFLLDRIRLGFNPRYFVDDLRHVARGGRRGK
ncbi:hypothetical protein ACFLUT_02815 [Chloroflexota bacterium]